MSAQLPARRLASFPVRQRTRFLADFESGSLRSVASPELCAQLRASARSTSVKDQRINIRLSSPDLQALRARALREGIPYQTLISSVLHKYISGVLKESPHASPSPK